MEGDSGVARQQAKPSNRLIYGLLSLMLAFWSGNFIIGKWALRELPPVLAGALRVVCASALVLPLYFWERRRAGNRQPTNTELPMVLLFAVGGISLNQVLFMVGLANTTVAHSSILVTLNPIVVLLMARFFGVERLTARRVVGMSVAATGVLVLQLWSSPGVVSQSGPSLMGDSFIVLSTLMLAAFMVLGKPVIGHHSAITVTTCAYVGAAVALTPVSLWLYRDFPFHRVSAGAWLSVLYMALFPSVLAYMIFSYALKHIGPTRLAAVTYMQPLLATSLAACTLGETITVPVVASGAVICSGVFIAERS
ncbi:MAG: DMT family transporter [Bryobacteraceae bacterium]